MAAFFSAGIPPEFFPGIPQAISLRVPLEIASDFFPKDFTSVFMEFLQIPPEIRPHVSPVVFSIKGV